MLLQLTWVSFAAGSAARSPAKSKIISLLFVMDSMASIARCRALLSADGLASQSVMGAGRGKSLGSGAMQEETQLNYMIAKKPGFFVPGRHSASPAAISCTQLIWYGCLPATLQRSLTPNAYFIQFPGSACLIIELLRSTAAQAHAARKNCKTLGGQGQRAANMHQIIAGALVQKYRKKT